MIANMKKNKTTTTKKQRMNKCNYWKVKKETKKKRKKKNKYRSVFYDKVLKSSWSNQKVNDCKKCREFLKETREIMCQVCFFFKLQDEYV